MMANNDTENQIYEDFKLKNNDIFELKRRLLNCETYEVTVVEIPSEFASRLISDGYLNVSSYLSTAVSSSADSFASLYSITIHSAD